MGETITTRVDDQMAKDIEFFSRTEKLDKSTITRRLLATSLKQKKLNYVLEKYKNGEIVWQFVFIKRRPIGSSSKRGVKL